MYMYVVKPRSDVTVDYYDYWGFLVREMQTPPPPTWSVFLWIDVSREDVDVWSPRQSVCFPSPPLSAFPPRLSFHIYDRPVMCTQDRRGTARWPLLPWQQSGEQEEERRKRLFFFGGMFRLRFTARERRFQTKTRDFLCVSWSCWCVQVAGGGAVQTSKHLLGYWGHHNSV